MSKVLVIAISTICTWLIIINFNNKTEVVNVNLASNIKKHEIKISEYLSHMMDSNEQARYKYLFKASTNGNLNSLKELIAFSCDGAYFYGHGVLIFKIVEDIGEEPFIKIIPSMSMEDRERLKFLLEVGLEYGGFDEQHESPILEKWFPKISETIDYYNNNFLCFAIRCLHIPLCKDR
jgi:hypothetical protein